MYNINMLKIIDLESDEVSQFWDNINYYFSIFKKSGPETYLYLKGNQTFEKLYSLTLKDQGKSLHSILNEKKLKLVHCLFEKYSASDQYIQFIDDVEEDSGISIWDVYGVFRNLELICMGIRRNTYEYFLFKRSLKYYEKMGDTLLLCKKARGFYVEDFSEGIYGLINENSDISGKLFVNLFPDSIQPDRLMSVIEQSLKVQTPLNYNIEIDNHVLLSNVHFTVIPLNFCKSVKILMHIHYAFQQDNPKNVTHGRSFEDTYQEGDFGVGQIDTVSHDFRFVTRINAYLERLFVLDNTNMYTILDSDIMRQCMDKKTTMSGRIMLKTEDENRSEYQLQIIPSIRNHEVVTMQVVVTPIVKNEENSNLIEENNDVKLENSINKMARMTPREREIIMLVLKGYTNKRISSMLIISEGTVKRTIHNAYQKLEIGSRIELARLML